MNKAPSSPPGDRDVSDQLVSLDGTRLAPLDAATLRERRREGHRLAGSHLLHNAIEEVLHENSTPLQPCGLAQEIRVAGSDMCLPPEDADKLHLAHPRGLEPTRSTPFRVRSLFYRSLKPISDFAPSSSAISFRIASKTILNCWS